MYKDVYLFTNGIVTVFDDAGQQVPGLVGITLTPGMKEEILANVGDGTRITFSRWRQGFFELTREEFRAVEFVDGTLILRFKRVSENVETSSPN